jgi:hypothetical protein
MEQIEVINKLMAKVDDLLHASYTGTSSSGEPMKRGLAIINNHRVDVYIIGQTVRVEIDKSTKPHTLAEAITALVK